MCVCVCVFVCMCVCVYVCLYVCVYVCLYVCVYVCEWAFEQIYACITIPSCDNVRFAKGRFSLKLKILYSFEHTGLYLNIHNE